MRKDAASLLLAGAIALGLALLTFSFCFAKLTDITRDTSRELPPVGAVPALASLHERLGAELAASISPRDPPELIATAILPLLREKLAEDAARLGLDAVVQLAPAGETAAHGAKYEAWSYDGSHHFASDFDGEDDGIIVEAPCPIDAALATGCVTGVAVEMAIQANGWGGSTPILFAVNVA